MTKHGLIIDLNRCVRCRTCYVACKLELNLPPRPDENFPYELYGVRYVEFEWGEYPNVRRAFIPVQCVHCENPICAEYCPVNAITKREDGIVQVDRDRCVGCGACTVVCPLGALYVTPDWKVGACDLCADRVDSGREPRCVELCPTGARIFGDLEGGVVGEMVKTGSAKPLLVRGNVFYIPSKNEPSWEELAENPQFHEMLEARRRDLPFEPALAVISKDEPRRMQVIRKLSYRDIHRLVMKGR